MRAGTALIASSLVDSQIAPAISLDEDGDYVLDLRIHVRARPRPLHTRLMRACARVRVRAAAMCVKTPAIHADSIQVCSAA